MIENMDLNKCQLSRLDMDQPDLATDKTALEFLQVREITANVIYVFSAFTHRTKYITKSAASTYID